ncbi:MAG: hypothetical protein RL071_4787 [Pseudomonadota bacterium]
MSPHRAGLVSLALVAGGGVVLGEVYPWSRYTMYADLGQRDHGAVPLVRVDGQQADLRDYVAFADLDPAAFRPPPDVPCSMLYVFDQQSEHVRGRLRAGPGPLPVEIGVLLVRPGPGGPQVEERVLQRGSAWPR